ncbi:FMN-dependent alpha-hydroxy acid dehydrogenase [Pisolithus albus]|nr:FMN-dependent alpha-hydroxy acid dehydrogenase [Pisolithus albus]
MTAEVPLPNKWTNYLVDIYVRGRPPVLGTANIKDIEEKAREAMKDHMPAYMYTFGSAGTCSTDSANKRAFENYRLVPRMLVDVSNRNIETTIFGVTYPSPLLVAPVGVQGLLHADAELATASAAASVGVPFIMSTASSRSIEDVAKANGPLGHRWYQLYWPRTAEITLSLLKRAKANGFTALVITLDTMILGWRLHDLETAYLPFAYGVGIQVGTSDPVFMQRFDLPPRENEWTRFPLEPEKIRMAALEQGDEEALRNMLLGKEWLGELNSGAFRTWDDLKFIKDNWEGPFILKGIQRVADAEKAIANGIDGIVVSNHGGRQVDGAIASLDALDNIMESRKVRAAQKSGKLTVLFDSGVRTGSDVLEALAIGAQGVLIGRPIMYGLAITGQEGVEQILLQMQCNTNSLDGTETTQLT